jgi:hypothetical protein
MRRLAWMLVPMFAACGARSGLEAPIASAREIDAGMDAPENDAWADDAASCVVIDAAFRVTTPTMVFVIDRSLSMNIEYIQAHDGLVGSTRWDAVLDVLVGDGGILRDLEGRVRLGAITFTSDTVTCPLVRSVDPALHNYDAIAALLASAGPEGGTPMAETMTVIAGRIDALTIDGDAPTFVLMTDGEPQGCHGIVGDPMGAVRSCFGAGARTYVIGLGDDVGEPYLRLMANAGVGVQPGEPDAEYWPAVEASRFLVAIDAIAQRVADCRAVLSEPIDPARACEATVHLAGGTLACNSPDGWAALDAHTIELRGEACTRLVQTGTDHVTLEAPCDFRP